MTNLGLPQLKLEGEKQVKKWLVDNGYTNIIKEALQASEYGFVAEGTIQNVLVLIRTFLHPHRPFKISDYEADLLARRAAKLELNAYVAYTTLDNTGELIGEINWERITQ